MATYSPRRTVGSFITGDRPDMQTHEAFLVRRAIRVSLAVGLVLGLLWYFLLPPGHSNGQPRLYGAFGVFAFSAVILGAIWNVAIMVQLRIDRRRPRD